MQITMELNGKKIQREVRADMLLIDFVREEGCYSVKRGCETCNCGLCTVLMDDTPVLSCSMPVGRANGHRITTLEGLQQDAMDLGGFIADEGADQCGFCNPGFFMSTFALLRENPDPTEEEVREYLAGNLCRCSGYMSEHRGIMKYIRWKQKKAAEAKKDESSCESTAPGKGSQL